MDTTTNTGIGTVEVSVRQTGDLSEYAKAHPEQQAVQYIERALTRLNVPYKIYHDLPPRTEAPKLADYDNTATYKDDAFTWWHKQIQNGNLEKDAKDSNILLLPTNGGGKAYIRGAACVAPAGTLDKDYPMKETVPADDPRGCVYGILHELAHNLGYSHNKPWGRAWNDSENGEWHRTPTAIPGKVNACGDQLPPKKEDTKIKHLYYGECARDELYVR